MGNKSSAQSSSPSLPIDTTFTLPSPLPSWPSGEGFAKGRIDLGGLEVCQVETFNKVWTIYEGGQDNLGATFFEPSSVPEGFSILGFYAQPNNRKLFGWTLRFYAFFSQNAGKRKLALYMYLDEPVLDMVAFQSLDILKYWKDNATQFKEPSRLICDVLCIPITTVPSESTFSVGNRVLNKHMRCHLPSNVQALIGARNWLRGFEEICKFTELYNLVLFKTYDLCVID